MPFKSKRGVLYIVLAMFFVTNAVVGELIGGKLIDIHIFDFSFKLSIGILPWPIIFLSTDLINEYFGKEGVRKLSIITSFLIVYAFLILFLAMNVPAADFSPVQNEEFNNVFGQSMWIIVGSITAFLVSQIIDVFVFWFFKSRTGEKMLWLRATGSTVVSQLIDSFIVLGIGFLLPGKISLDNYISVGFTNYSGKLIIAILLTPFIYLAHFLIDRCILRDETAMNSK